MNRKAMGFSGVVCSTALGCLLTAAPTLAAPGDPLGGAHTGCAPADESQLKCGIGLTRAVAKLTAKALRCQLSQSNDAFKLGMGTQGLNNQEALCELNHPNKSAKAKFDETVAKFAASCSAAQLANADARRDVLLGGQAVPGSLDALNADIFCDSTSGAFIDPDGGTGGSIASTPEHHKCEVTVAKAWSKLDYAVHRCHERLAKAVFSDKVFDADVCETAPGVPTPKSALARYQRDVQRAIVKGICPPCLADSAALALGTDTVADLDAQTSELFICPGP